MVLCVDLASRKERDCDLVLSKRLCAEESQPITCAKERVAALPPAITLGPGLVNPANAT